MVGVMNSLEPSIRPRQLVSTLSVAKKQIVEIAKAVAAESDIIIMDEPTAAISESEIARTLHDHQEPAGEERDRHLHLSPPGRDFRAGRLRHGHAGRQAYRHPPVSEIKDRSELIRMMIGKTVFEQYTPKEGECRDAILQVRNLSNHKLQRHFLRCPRGGDRRVLRPRGRGKDRACARHLRRGRLRGGDPLQGEEAPALSRTRQSRRGSPWCRRKDGRRGFSPSSPSAATCPS